MDHLDQMILEVLSHLNEVLMGSPSCGCGALKLILSRWCCPASQAGTGSLSEAGVVWELVCRNQISPKRRTCSCTYCDNCRVCVVPAVNKELNPRDLSLL